MATRFEAPTGIQFRVLLVDDNPDGLKARKAVLEELGYRLTTTTDASRAIELFSKDTFDLVITDYKMTGMTGTELIAALRVVRPTACVVLLSGFVDALGLTEENTGADAVLQKNANEVQQLVRTVNRLLRRKPTRKPPSSAATRRQTKPRKSAG